MDASGNIGLVQRETTPLLLPASAASTLLLLERVSLMMYGGLREDR
jgi:hypothetical protein